MISQIQFRDIDYIMLNIDGKVKNLFFKIFNVFEWKEIFFEYFGLLFVISLKDGKVVKVLFEINKIMNVLKINFYDKVLLLYKVKNVYYMLIYIFKFLRIKLIKQIKLVMIEDDIQIVYLKNLV